MDDQLLPLFERAVAQVRGPGARLSGVSRRENPNATLFPTELVRLSVTGGPDLEVFLKRLTREQVQHPDKLGPEVEVQVYRDLFQGVPNLAVPRYLGSAPIEGADGFVLLLGYVAGRRLKHCPPIDWCTAASRLGELHRIFGDSANQAAGRPWLFQMDARYYLDWADRAAAVATASSAHLAGRLDEALTDYRRFVDQIVSLPLTLVHNDLSSRNVLVDGTSTPPEIYFVDWETSALGCGLVDLIHMKYNRLDTEADRAVTVAYLEALGHPDLVSPDEEHTRRLLDAVELHFTFYRIAHSASWGESIDQLTRRVERAAALRERLES
jgi:Ser/Thr protein kinase RdoA (MazF antagonist)